MDLSRIDLNLLVVLRVLLEEQSVTRAARRLKMSQPAMSNALARLRALFGDSLLVRSGAKMTPTLRAQELAAELERAFYLLEGALTPKIDFQGATATHHFSIAATDFIEMVLLPRLAAKLSQEAPRVTVEVRHIGENPVYDSLGAGSLDLAIGVFFQSPTGIYRQELFRERLICVARKGHPALQEDAMSLEVFAKQPHLLVATRKQEPGIIDQKLAERGFRRHIAMYVPHFLIAPQIVAQSDLIVTLPERAARLFAQSLSLTLFPPPVALSGFAVSQTWHERTHQSPPHRWLRNLFAQVSASLT